MPLGHPESCDNSITIIHQTRPALTFIPCACEGLCACMKFTCTYTQHGFESTRDELGTEKEISSCVGSSVLVF